MIVHKKNSLHHSERNIDFQTFVAWVSITCQVQYRIFDFRNIRACFELWTALENSEERHYQTNIISKFAAFETLGKLIFANFRPLMSQKFALKISVFPTHFPDVARQGKDNFGSKWKGFQRFEITFWHFW